MVFQNSPPPDLPTSDSHGDAGEPGRGVAAQNAGANIEHEAIRMPLAGPGGRRRLALVRLLLLALSTVGVGVAFVLLASGHLTLAGRVLAGDLLLIFGILIIV